MADKTQDEARAFLAGAQCSFTDADALWRKLKSAGKLSLAREVLGRLRSGEGHFGPTPASRSLKAELCREFALLTSKDTELSASVRHDRAIEVLAQCFDLEETQLNGDPETLGIAGGIYKRRWNDLGQLDDLIRSWKFYERGAKGPLGDDAYTQINAALLADLLAQVGISPDEHRARARSLRERIVAELPQSGSWWNAASRAEALFGLSRYSEAEAVIRGAGVKPESWALQTLVQQLGTLAVLQTPRPLADPEMRRVFEALLPGNASAVRSAVAGKLGLALSGGGFRASFYHLGVLARLAELDVLRNVEVLSCVSGGSIVGVSYWLALRARMLDPSPMTREDYVKIVRDVIGRFEKSVATDLRGAAQPTLGQSVWRFVQGAKGVLNPEDVACLLEENFYRPLMPGTGTLYMHDLAFIPADHKPAVADAGGFNPSDHNWLRANKVPLLVLNATTVNTAHAWQFTPTWMGESPWAVHELADSIPRLEWSPYKPGVRWQMALGRAVAASACVPGVFEPLRIECGYEGMDVQLVDGGVHDNQGTVSLLAQNCNVLLVSDASGQLLLEEQPTQSIGGLGKYAVRSMNILMERIRLANFADLRARQSSGLLRGLMFLHMKAGLDADTKRLSFSKQAYELRRAPLTPSGVRKDFEQALAELRTDLNAFSEDESRSLMACGYQMTVSAFERDVAALPGLCEKPVKEAWPFADALREITSLEAGSPKGDALLKHLRAGRQVSLH